MLNLYLFDMDSVLLHPGSYRAAFQETTNFFAQQMGLGDLAPTDDEIEAIEAMGITSEWDSAPISIADIILHGERPQYIELAKRVHDAWRKGEEYPAETAHRLILESSSSPLANSEQIKNILLHSRDVHVSPVMYVFQQFILGDAFEATYGMPRSIESHSMLLLHDRKALDRPVPPHSAIYTARPCKAPRDVAQQFGYAPEAEIGAEFVGLSHLPIIGVGSFEWLVKELGNGTRAEELVKPSPVHGLAAIGAAAGNPESLSIIAAEAASRGEWISPLKELREQVGKVTVFEDSATSIAGVREAVGMLGPNWSYVGIGIADGGPKMDVLVKVSDRVYPSINHALDGELNG